MQVRPMRRRFHARDISQIKANELPDAAKLQMRGSLPRTGLTP